MQRKHFLASAIGTGVILTAAAAVFADTSTPVPEMTLQPGEPNGPCGPRRIAGGAPFANPNPDRSPDPNRAIEEAERRLSHIIHALERDPNDYSGHKQQAIGYMQQALTQLQNALAGAGVNFDNPIQSQT